MVVKRRVRHNRVAIQTASYRAMHICMHNIYMGLLGEGDGWVGGWVMWGWVQHGNLLRNVIDDFSYMNLSHIRC